MTTQMTEREAIELFEEYLNEVSEKVDILGMQYLPAHVLKNVDEIAYNELFNNWMDAENIEIEE